MEKEKLPEHPDFPKMYAAVERLRPREIMIYVIDRATPVKTLEKLSRDEMEAIAAPLIANGYKVIISA